jgi:hypothetical protein
LGLNRHWGWAVGDRDESNGSRESCLSVVQLDRDRHPALIVAGRARHAD